MEEDRTVPDSTSNPANIEEDKEFEEEKKKILELLKEHHVKKAKKPAHINKSSIVLDVKPRAEETDMAEMERQVRSISMDGLVWGCSELVPIAYRIKKLRITCMIEDEKCGCDILTDEIEGFGDFVQSADVYSFDLES